MLHFRPSRHPTRYLIESALPVLRALFALRLCFGRVWELNPSRGGRFAVSKDGVRERKKLFELLYFWFCCLRLDWYHWAIWWEQRKNTWKGREGKERYEIWYGMRSKMSKITITSGGMSYNEHSWKHSSGRKEFYTLYTSPWLHIDMWKSCELLQKLCKKSSWALFSWFLLLKWLLFFFVFFPKELLFGLEWGSGYSKSSRKFEENNEGDDRISYSRVVGYRGFGFEEWHIFRGRW